MHSRARYIYQRGRRRKGAARVRASWSNSEEYLKPTLGAVQSYRKLPSPLLLSSASRIRHHGHPQATLSKTRRGRCRTRTTHRTAIAAIGVHCGNFKQTFPNSQENKRVRRMMRHTTNFLKAVSVRSQELRPADTRTNMSWLCVGRTVENRFMATHTWSLTCTLPCELWRPPTPCLTKAHGKWRTPSACSSSNEPTA